MSTLKCYLVDCGQENGAQLYFAATPGQAKRQCANEEGCDFIEIGSCKRRPRYDVYAPGPVPPIVLIGDGWWYECAGCGHRVEEDMDDTTANGEALRATVHERYPEYVWCSESCRDTDVAEMEAKRARLASAREKIAAKFPATIIDHIWEAADGEIRAQLKVPGMQGLVSWQLGTAFVGVHPDDLEAWKRYEAALSSQSAEGECNG